jgi:hypothetical protein
MNLRPAIFIAACILISFSLIAQDQIPNDTIITVYSDDTLAVFKKVEFEASFPGGEMEWRKFLERNLRADVAAEHGAPAGIYTVLIQFVVDKEGNLSDIKSLTNWGYGMEAEVVRILKKSPKWSPAIQNGKPVKAYRKQPVTFMIEEDGYQIITEEPYTIYSGIENPIKIIADKVKAEDLEVILSQGTIIPKGGGNYIVRVSKPGRVIIQLFNKKHRQIGETSLEVKQKGQSSTPQTLKS